MEHSGPGAVCQAGPPRRPAMPHRTYTLADFDFELPPELIAQHPAAERSASRLLDGRGAHAGRPRLPRPAAVCCAPATCWSSTTRASSRRGCSATRPAAARSRRWSSACCPATRCWPICAPASRPGRAARLRFADAFDAEVLGRAGPDEALFHLRFPADPLRCCEAPRPRAAAALHHARRRRAEDERALPDRVRRTPGRGGRADRGAALRRGAARRRCRRAASDGAA